MFPLRRIRFFAPDATVPATMTVNVSLEPLARGAVDAMTKRMRGAVVIERRNWMNRINWKDACKNPMTYEFAHDIASVYVERLTTPRWRLAIVDGHHLAWSLTFAGATASGVFTVEYRTVANNRATTASIFVNTLTGIVAVGANGRERPTSKRIFGETDVVDSDVAFDYEGGTWMSSRQETETSSRWPSWKGSARASKRRRRRI